MDPVIAPKPRKINKLGTAENPEVFTNVPGHVIPIIEQEFEDFATETGSFLAGTQEELEYIPKRLRQGVYGQRQPGVQMTRIKLPFGGVTPDQLESFADAAEQWAPLKKAHITTRQAIQLHHIPLARVESMLRHISKSGLTSREGCGNTVRNVTGDPFAGVLPGELFDTTPYAGAFARYFVRSELTQLMPRKCKVAFDGAPELNRSITSIHDIGFEAAERDGELGFRVLVGGGTSIFPRVAWKLFEFVTFDEYLKVSEAVLRIFNRCDELRVNRARARIKVYIDRIGIDAFRDEVTEEMKGDWIGDRDFDPNPLMFIDDESADAAPMPEAAALASPNGDLTAFNAFSEHNVFKQKQDGYSTIGVRVFRGDLTPEQLRGLAAISRTYSSGRLRTTQDQNLVMRWVPDAAVYEVWQKLSELDLGGSGFETVQDVVSCPGTDSCKLGITASMGVNKAVHDRIAELNITDPLTKQIDIRMSGCPNGCSQHHIASIGFNGAAMKFNGKTVPAYIVQIGGRGKGRVANFGQRLKVRIPAKRVPDAIERWLALYESERNSEEPFADFVERVGTKPFEDAARELTLPVEYSSETEDVFVDWQRQGLFEVIRGEGECAI